GRHLGKIENACAKGVAHLRSGVNPGRRATSLVNNQSTSVEGAIEAAARLLSGAKNTLVFGLESSTLEAQAAAIDLARKLGAVIDDASYASYGGLLQSIFSGDLPTCSLAEVKDKADLLVYWGSDPPQTHPRHISRSTYYAYTDYDPAGWYPRVTMTCVDVRDTELSRMCKPVLKIRPGEDRNLMEAIAGVAEDRTKQTASASCSAAWDWSTLLMVTSASLARWYVSLVSGRSWL
ncbi:MAG: molybdopterin-dependent oxidoreductase, partial [Chloroflexi bacterium]|nr:molybdopterin-dependent oxidoreductase [Chloroflexota bacterium]